MTKKRVIPANLTNAQKSAIKADIRKMYPNLKLGDDELEFLIEQYNQDKDYIKNIMKGDNPAEAFLDEVESKGGIASYKPEDPEYIEAMEKMRKAREEYEAKISVDKEKIEDEPISA